MASSSSQNVTGSCCIMAQTLLMQKTNERKIKCDEERKTYL